MVRQVVRGIKVPYQLKAHGRALWVSTLEHYDLADHEKQILCQACMVLDTTFTLSNRIKNDGIMSTGSKGQPSAHPLLAELRQQRALFAQLVRELKLPADAGGVQTHGGKLTAVPETNGQRSGGLSRWSKAYG